MFTTTNDDIVVTITADDDITYTPTTGAIGATGSVYTYPDATGIVTSNGINYEDLTFGPITNGGGTLHVRGPAVFEDEVTIGGKNLSETLEAINKRLNILTINPELESRWSELSELSQRYRELEAECLAKEHLIKILSE